MQLQASQVMNELHYHLLQPNIYHFPCDSSNNITVAAHDDDEYSQNISNNNNHPLYQVYNNISPDQGQGQGQEVRRTKWTCLSSNSTTSDEAVEQQQQQMSIIIHERKQRRMISNRESARRSRMRKQRHLDELWSQVVWLRNQNQQLMEKLNHASENHTRLLEDNSHLKEELSDLRKMLLNIDHHSTTLSNLP